MVVIDTNVLLYAANRDSPLHDKARGALTEYTEKEYALTLGIVYEFLRVATHLHGGRPVFVHHAYLGDVALDEVERGEEHLFRAHALRIDIAIAHSLQHLVHDTQLRKIVGRGLLRLNNRVVCGDRRRQTFPESTATPQGNREIARNTEGSENDDSP